ncbi:MAG: pilus assembly protein TadG-related protein [Pseudomonadota bacterium]
MKTFLNNFATSEEGTGTYIAGAAMFFGSIIGGFALDTAQGNLVQLKLQIATDAAALAAAANIDNPTQARAIAMQTIQMNLGKEASAIRDSDIRFGHVDPETLEFVAGPSPDGSMTAVSVSAERSAHRDNAVSTLLVRYVGLSDLERYASTVAAARTGGGGGAFASCEDAVLLSEGEVRVGGGLNLNGAVCVHGAQGVWTAGGATFSQDVRFSANDMDAIAMAPYAPSSIPEEQLKIARYLDPVLLPGMDGIEDNLWLELAGECRWNTVREDDDDDDANGRKPISEILAVDGLYLGATIPDFVLSRGTADIVCLEDDVAVNASDLMPNTIYASLGHITVKGDASLDRIALVSRGDVQIQGGANRNFDRMFLHADKIDLGSKATWGTEFACSEDSYRVYAFGRNEIRMGGSSTLHNVVSVAPTIVPAGNLTASGLYMESHNDLHLKGSTKITSCEQALSSEFDLANGAFESTEATGSILVD